MGRLPTRLLVVCLFCLVCAACGGSGPFWEEENRRFSATIGGLFLFLSWFVLPVVYFHTLNKTVFEKHNVVVRAAIGFFFYFAIPFAITAAISEQKAPRWSGYAWDAFWLMVIYAAATAAYSYWYTMDMEDKRRRAALKAAANAPASQAGNATSSASSSDFAEPTRNKRTKFRTFALEAWIDHDSGEIDGIVLKGSFIARHLSQLNAEELEALLAECVADGESLRVLEAYIERRLGAEWRDSRHTANHSSSEMTRDEALDILGLDDRATLDDVRAAHSRLIRRVHPDVGGTNYLAVRINTAKDVLLRLPKR